MGLGEEINNIFDKDPAARSKLEVLLCYPGLHALMFHKVAHCFYKWRFYTTARFISHISRVLTGIEIHPGAKFGRRVMIDHGMGIVVGETAEVGDDCCLYQGVTLGAGREAREGEATRGVKRHPTLGKGVIVGSGAEIQGGVTVGDNVRVASGSIVLRDIPPDCIVVGVPGRVIYQRGKRVEEKAPDIEAEALKSMKLRIEELEHRLEKLATQVVPVEPAVAALVDESRSVTGSKEGIEDPVEVFLHGSDI
jgi:serine O-acetyltransferase